MGNEVGPEYVFDQGVYYPVSGNYYGYYSTGFEATGEWDDYNRFFAVEGQDPNFSGLQTENPSYAYYAPGCTPGYAYAQSPYNPYNPYIPGAIVGVDGAFMGSQQYVTSPSYQQTVTPPAYYPLVVQSGSDITPISSPDLSMLTTSFSNVNSSSAMSYIPAVTSTVPIAVSQRTVSRSSMSELSQSSGHQITSTVKGSEGLHVVPNKLTASRDSSKPGSVSQDPQVRIYSGSNQTNGSSWYKKDTSAQPVKITVPATNGFTSIGSDVRGWANADKFRPRYYSSGSMNNESAGSDVLGEQNKGPRTSKSKGSPIVVRAYTTKAGDVDADGKITIHRDQYNRDDFSLVYPDAKFFVIKSYSEDDVHKSVKYNVWSSTPNGNKRLDSAYAEAQRISSMKSRKCPVFLFFSVNASGQFCGVAEMIGPVDFSKDMDFWQQDKWTGSFPVKWHFVKDVPNTSFRHIILENNENKPVTNSRDTQEITYIPGINMLSIFKNSPLRTSILDDFKYYEERQRVVYEEKQRLLGRGYSTLLMSYSTLSNKSPGQPMDHGNADGKSLNWSIKNPQEGEGKQLNGAQSLQSMAEGVPEIVMDEGKPKGNEEPPSITEALEANCKENSCLDGKLHNPISEEHAREHCQEPVSCLKKPTEAEEIQVGGVIDQPLEGDANQPKDLGVQLTTKKGNLIKHNDFKASCNTDSNEIQTIQVNDTSETPSEARKDTDSDKVGDSNGVSSVLRIGTLSIDSKTGGAKHNWSDMADGATVEVVTVGSMPIKVKKPGESGFLTVGSIPIDPSNGVKFEKHDDKMAFK